MDQGPTSPVQVSVFTGFLGAGKTTIILNLIQRLKTSVPNYKVAILKNEFGDIQLDSLLATESAIHVTEILNGCLCCVLVGQMETALLQIKDSYNPDRIIIESSGSAFPAPIAWQIRQLEPLFHLDSIITVIDLLNFRGYEDTSYTAKMQAQYTDLILLNKHELTTERETDLVLEHVYELNQDTPKIKYTEQLDLDLVFGLDTQLFTCNDHSVSFDSHMTNEVDLIQIQQKVSNTENTSPTSLYSLDQWKSFLSSLNKDDIYRVKGLIRTSDNTKATVLYIVNHAFGRSSFTLVQSLSILKQSAEIVVSLTVMGVSLVLHQSRFKSFLSDDSLVSLKLAHQVPPLSTI